MASNWRTVRVFISSTFLDMQAERDHLVRFVFPRLREKLLKRRIHLVDVDLRWGVRGERDASKVCREIITECQPRFLCMLGGRYGTIPEKNQLSITADEIHFGVLNQCRETVDALFCFRHGAVTEAMDRSESKPGTYREPRKGDPEKKASKLAKLKRDIRATKNPVFRYRPRWNSNERRLVDLKSFGERIEQYVLASLEGEFARQPSVQTDEFEEANADIEAFVQEKIDSFVLGSREPVLEKLVSHATSAGDHGYCCITGEPGSGKTALLGHFSEQPDLQASSILLVRHFVGATLGSADVRRTIVRLCRELKSACSEIQSDIPDDSESLRNTFHGFLQQAGNTDRRVVIILDGVDQFQHDADLAGFSWLPRELPGNSRIILSALEGRAMEELCRQLRKVDVTVLQPLTGCDCEAIIERFLSRYGKELEPEQHDLLLAKSDADNPLYLRAAMEELRTLGTHDEISQRIKELPSRTRDLYAWILQRLKDDDGFRDAAGRRVGKKLVSQFASLLVASRNGLSHIELVDLLDAGDPQGNVAALLHLLRPYLMRRGELIDFYHGQFREAAAAMHRQRGRMTTQAHRRLARYFFRELMPQGGKPWSNETPRALSELPYHQTHGKLWKELMATLCDIQFLQKKCTAGMAFDLVLDFQSVPQASLDGEDAAEFSRYQQFVVRSIDLLSRYPSMTWLQWTSGWETQNPLIQGTNLLQSDVTAMAWSPNETHVAIGDKAGRILIVDVATSKPSTSMYLDDQPISQVHWFDDGIHLLTSTVPRPSIATTRIWNTVSAKCVSKFNHHLQLDLFSNPMGVTFLQYDPPKRGYLDFINNVGQDLMELDGHDGFRHPDPLGCELVANNPMNRSFSDRRLSVSPDGRFLAIVCEDMYVLWVGVIDRTRMCEPNDSSFTWTGTGEDFFSFGTDSAIPTPICWSPNSETFVLLDVSTILVFKRCDDAWSKPVQYDGLWMDGAQRIQSCRFISDRCLLVSVKRDGEPVLLALDLLDFTIAWENKGWLLTGQVGTGRRNVIGLPNGIGILECAADGATLDCKVTSQLDGHGHVAALSLSGQRVAAISAAGKLRTFSWDLKESKDRGRVASQRRSGPFALTERPDFRLTRDGQWRLSKKHLSSGGRLSMDGVSHSEELLRASFPADQRTPRLHRSQHPNRIPITWERSSEDGRKDECDVLWIAGAGGVRKIYDTDVCTQLFGNDGLLAPDGASLAFDIGGGVVFVELDPTPSSWCCRCWKFDHFKAAALQWSHDSRFLALSSSYRPDTVVVLDVKALRQECETSGRDQTQSDAGITPGGTSLAWTPDDRRILMARGAEFHVLEWNGERACRRKTLMGAPGAISDIITLDNNECFTLCQGRYLVRWNLAEERIVAVLLLATSLSDCVYVDNPESLICMNAAGETYELPVDSS